MREPKEKGKSVQSWSLSSSPRVAARALRRQKKNELRGLQSQEWPREHTGPRWDKEGGQRGWERQGGGGGKAHRWWRGVGPPLQPFLQETLQEETLWGPRAWFGRLKAPGQADEGGLSPTRHRELAEPTAL